MRVCPPKVQLIHIQSTANQKNILKCSFPHSLADNMYIMTTEILFYQLFMCAATTAFNLYAIEANGVLDMHAATSIYILLTVLAGTFTCCYLSESLTADLSAIGQTFYDSKWYLLPVPLKTLVMLTIQQSQSEFQLRGFNIIDCSLSVFGMVNFFGSIFFTVGFEQMNGGIFNFVWEYFSYFLGPVLLTDSPKC